MKLICLEFDKKNRVLFYFGKTFFAITVTNYKAVFKGI